MFDNLSPIWKTVIPGKDKRKAKTGSFPAVRRGIFGIFMMLLLLSFLLWTSPRECFAKQYVGQWKRYEAQFRNLSWQGNPFDVILRVSFTAPSGKVMEQYGFYAGDSLWKVFFMPCETGRWSYRTRSDDPDLDGKTGGFTCVRSNLEPMLTASGKHWVLKEKGGDFPVIWAPVTPDGKPWGFRGGEASDPVIDQVLRYAADTVGARLLGFGEIMLAKKDWAAGWPQSALPYVTGREGEEFYLPFWDQMNARLDKARDLNMGAYIMIYSDDAMTPDRYGITPRSAAELRLLRYVVARLACYPHILWDTGIDIGEYRKNDWISWFVSWFRKNDPWQHPVGSRSGGGSGGFMPANATYYSLGGASLPSRAQLLSVRKNSGMPVANTDHWRIFIRRGNWNNDKIRTALWRCALSGAQALYPDYNQGKPVFTLIREGARYTGIATRFFRKDLHVDISSLTPHDELVTQGDHAILAASPGEEYVVYDEDGGTVALDLSASGRSYHVVWINPRTGIKTKKKKIKGGAVRHFTAPDDRHDWVLHLY